MPVLRAHLSSLKRNHAPSFYFTAIILLITLASSRFAFAQSGTTTLAWDANPESDLAGYILHYGLNSGVYSLHLDVGPSTTNTVSNLLDGVTYYFAVTAYNIAGLESEFSNELTNTVPFANAPPIISLATNVVVNEDTSFTISFAVQDPDTPVAALTLTARSTDPSLISPANILFEGIGTNRIARVTPSTNQAGAAIITFVVGDGLRTTESSCTVTVNPVNDPPTLGPLSDLKVPENALLQTVLLSNITSGAANEIQLLTVTVTSTNTTLIPTPIVTYVTPLPGGQITFAPRSNRTGTSKITVSVSDGQSTTSRSFVAYVPDTQNSSPTISSISNRTINEDVSTGPIPFTVSDSITPNALLQVTATSSDTLLIPANRLVLATTSTNRTLTITPAANGYGTALVTVAVADTNFGYASTSFQLTVLPLNDRPTISTISNQLAPVGVSPWIVPFTISDVETPASSLALTATSSNLALVQNSGLTFGGTGTNRALIISAVTNQVGSSIISVVVSDGTATATNRFTFTITNSPPQIAVTNLVACNEDTPSDPIAIFISDRETSAESLRLSVTSLNETLLPAENISLVGSQTNRSLSFVPAPDKWGTGVLVITVTDSIGAVMSTNVVIHVEPVNDAPSFDPIADIMARAPGPQTLTISGIHAGPSNEIQTLAVTASTANFNTISNIAISYDSPSPVATLTFDLLDDATPGFITVTVSDGGGTLSGGEDTISQTFAVIPFTPPRLQIERDGDTVRIRWPSIPTNYQLEHYSGTFWSPDTSFVAAANGTNEVALLPASEVSLYRLQRR